MNKRRTGGDETWNRLLTWTKGQKSSERLAAHILRAEGFKSVDLAYLRILFNDCPGLKPGGITCARY